MTIKELFAKVNAYNELAELMHVSKAKVSFYDYGIFHGETFDSFKDFRKWLKKNYIDEVAEPILKLTNVEFDKEFTVDYTDSFGSYSERCSFDLVSD